MSVKVQAAKAVKCVEVLWRAEGVVTVFNFELSVTRL